MPVRFSPQRLAGFSFVFASSAFLSSAARESSMAASQKTASSVVEAIKEIEVEKIKGPSDSPQVKVGSFWKDQTAVVHVLRRFGCKLCRANALELQKLAPTLEAKNVRIVAIGIEKLGLEEFQEGGFWNGELYIDNGKKIHQALSLKTVGILSVPKMLYDVRNAIKTASEVPGNLKGDGRQLGATFVISKDGEVLMDFRQKDFADHPSNKSILEACGIDISSVPSDLLKEGENVACTNN